MWNEFKHRTPTPVYGSNDKRREKVPIYPEYFCHHYQLGCISQMYIHVVKLPQNHDLASRCQAIKESWGLEMVPGHTCFTDFTVVSLLSRSHRCALARVDSQVQLQVDCSWSMQMSLHGNHSTVDHHVYAMFGTSFLSSGGGEVVIGLHQQLVAGHLWCCQSRACICSHLIWKRSCMSGELQWQFLQFRQCIGLLGLTPNKCWFPISISLSDLCKSF